MLEQALILYSRPLYSGLSTAQQSTVDPYTLDSLLLNKVQ